MFGSDEIKNIREGKMIGPPPPVITRVKATYISGFPIEGRAQGGTQFYANHSSPLLGLSSPHPRKIIFAHCSAY